MIFSNLKVCLLLSTCGIVLSQVRDHSDDFYWRDYNGEVPKDALPAGLDREHKNTYIGQVVSMGTLIPGQVFAGIEKIYYSSDYSARVGTNNIKIFCTKHPENFEWIKTNKNDAKLLARSRVIPGGYQYGDHIYIGRGIGGNLLSVGRVYLPTDSSSTASFKTAVNSEVYTPFEFEVLSYRVQNVEESTYSSAVTFYAIHYTSMLLLIYLSQIIFRNP